MPFVAHTIPHSYSHQSHNQASLEQNAMFLGKGDAIRNEKDGSVKYILKANGTVFKCIKQQPTPMDEYPCEIFQEQEITTKQFLLNESIQKLKDIEREKAADQWWGNNWFNVIVLPILVIIIIVLLLRR
jgi:hypothetical protein